LELRGHTLKLNPATLGVPEFKRRPDSSDDGHRPKKGADDKHRTANNHGNPDKDVEPIH